MGHPGGQGECEACRLGKQTRQPFSKQRERTKIVGEEISADVVGPISPVSLGGSRYFLTIVDTASRYAWIRILKAKSQDSNETYMWGEEPKLEKIRPVGSGVLYSIHHFERIGKLDPRCEKGVLIGFDEGIGSYRIWNPETRKVVRSRDVVFGCGNDDVGEIFIDEFEAEPQETTVTTDAEPQDLQPTAIERKNQ